MTCHAKRTIVFKPDGTVEFTRSTQVEQLMPQADKSMSRMTDIAYSPPHKCYYAKWLTGPYAGTSITYAQYFSATGDAKCMQSECIMRAGTYEAMVAIEVAVVDHMRKIYPDIDLHT